MEYKKEIKKDTSVKTIGVILEPTEKKAGIADFRYNPVYSVFDFGTIEEDVALDNSTVCLMAGFNFELLQENGIPTHYISLVDEDDCEIYAKDAIAKGLCIDTMRLQFVNRIKPEFKDGKWDYSIFKDPPVNNYVHPVEFIMRNELPESSSVWRRIEKGEITLTDLGLPESIKAGDKIPNPILDYSTKFEPSDRYTSVKETQEILAMDDCRFKRLNETTLKLNKIMTDYAASRGFDRKDGKIEYIAVADTDKVGDVVCTWHEDRLVIYGIGISKQRIRDKQKSYNAEWYEEIERAKDEAKEKGVEDFRTLINLNIKRKPLPRDFLNGFNNLLRAGTNQWVGKKVYKIYPDKQESLEDNLKRAVEEFEKVN